MCCFRFPWGNLGTSVRITKLGGDTTVRLGPIGDLTHVQGPLPLKLMETLNVIVKGQKQVKYYQ